MNRRVVITGMGALTPIGNNVTEFWDSLKAGKNGIAPITYFNTDAFKVKIAAELKDFDPEKYMDRKSARRFDRFCQYAMVAADMAMEDSGIDLSTVDMTRFGVIIGSGIGGLDTFEKQANILATKGPNSVSPLFIPMLIGNMASGNVSIKYGLKGFSSCSVTACASGTHSIGDAFRQIKFGYADRMLAGGAEASITQLGLAGFINITALTQSDDVSRASIPFDKARSGFVMGEGAGVLLLEEYDAAVARGAKIYAEVTGYGATADAYHMTAPDPEGEGAKNSMLLAMKEAGISPEDVDYINAHGTSTPLNDLTETCAIKKAFGDAAYKVAVSSTKSMTGHLLGAAGAVEAIACTMAIVEGFIPPTIGYQDIDSECDLDYVPNFGREGEVNHALSNSLGFGGHNATLAFSKVK
ncbi:MAG: beta-ketoacyl-ACP synthase II [Bacillota bacterium]